MVRRTILVVDEDSSTIQIVSHALDHAYEVVSALSCDEVYKQIEKRNAALVILAPNLQTGQCWELVAALKAQWPALPVVFATARLDSEAILAAFRAGCIDVLKKPLQAAEVRACLHRIWNAPAAEHSQPLQHAYTRIKRIFSSSLPSPENIAAPGAFQAHALETSSPEGRRELKSETENLLRLEVHFFGKFRVAVNGREVANWPGRKSKLVFAYLAMNHKRRLSREVLMETFWPSAEPDSARNSLNVALHQVRRALHEAFPACDFILFKEECYFLNPDLEVWLDVEEFKQHWKKAQGLERDKGREAALPEFEQAANMYEGDFMEDDIYESWAASQREHFKEIYLVALDRISKVYSLNGKPELAANLCESILALDNCREDIHRRLMLCYYRVGKRDKALKQFKKCEAILQEELEVKPTRATLELYEKIKTGSAKKRNFLAGIKRGLSAH